MEEVDYVSGRTRLYGIVGDPIEQVRSPEMVTAELRARELDAVLVPMHLAAEDFDGAMPGLMRLANLDGLILTIPFKARGCALVDELGPQGQRVGAINALVRRHDGRWQGEMFDGLGCVAAFGRRGIRFAGASVMLVGCGGAGAAIALAVADERPAAIRLHDLDRGRAHALAERLRQLDGSIAVSVGDPQIEGIDLLLNATPAGMLGDPSLPIAATSLPRSLVVFDAVVKPETTPLLALATRCGCTVVRGREMMRGQIARIVDYFISSRDPSNG